MTEIGIVRQVAGEWNGAQGLIRLRIDAEKLDQPLDASIAPRDVQSLIGLLLILSGKAGPPAFNEIADSGRTIRPLPLHSVALGETDEGGTVLELNIGQAALAFFLPTGACQMLGQKLLTVGASRSGAAH